MNPAEISRLLSQLTISNYLQLIIIILFIIFLGVAAKKMPGLKHLNDISEFTVKIESEVSEAMSRIINMETIMAENLNSLNSLAAIKDLIAPVTEIAKNSRGINEAGIKNLDEINKKLQAIEISLRSIRDLNDEFKKNVMAELSRINTSKNS